MNNNTVWFDEYITIKQREELNGHMGCVIWLTGLSASGKSSIAKRLEKELHMKQCSVYVLDGDNVRHGLCGDLGFSKKDRYENIRRIGEMAKLFIDAGIIVIAAFISPYIKNRENVRSLVETNRFIEVFVDCPVEVCKKRDPKGIYKKALKENIQNFTGINDPYEKPVNPDIHLKTDEISIEESCALIMKHLYTNTYLSISKP